MIEAHPQPKAQEDVTLEHFLEGVHPGKAVRILKLAAPNRLGNEVRLLTPKLQLHCETKICNRVQVFESGDYPVLLVDQQSQRFLKYICKNCEQSSKTFSLLISLDPDGRNGEVEKYGEIPSFGPPTPAKVMTLIGDERDYFLKGRRCENQGLGIAAFAYYRRVVENRTKQIISEITKVAKTIGAAQDVMLDLDAAAKEIQFSKAVESIKHGVPQVLLIDGHNPLTLLHSALSEGLHSQSDAECLELATSIRVVLTALVERIGFALKDEVVLATAVNRLLKAHAAKATPK